MSGVYKVHEPVQKEAENCKNCGNVFRVELVKDSSDYNDFGYRFCPFCGTFYDELDDEVNRKVVPIKLSS